jgi:RNA polymerase-binding transcription factor DksA
MDEKYLEQADAFAENLVREGLEKNKTEQDKPENYDGFCPTCGDEVPEERIALGKYNCVPCQSAEEYRKKFRR